jgi:hypothetical protein
MHKPQDLLAPIPTLYRQTFRSLHSQVCWLRHKWRQYVGLFGHNQQRIDLLQEGGAFFVTILHDVFFDDAILSLCRLFDRAETFGNANLSLPYLQRLLEHNGEKEFAAQLGKQIELARTSLVSLKEHRDKRIGHLDHSAVTSDGHVWPSISRAMFEQAIDRAEECLKIFERHFAGEAVDGWLMHERGGWEAHLTALAKARAYDRLVAQKLIAPNTHRQFIQGVE